MKSRLSWLKSSDGFGWLVLPLLFLAIELPSISLYPLVWGDEAMLNDPGLQLLTTGNFRSDVFSSIPNYANFYFWQPPGLALTTAASYLLFGFGIWQTRLPGLVFAAVTVGMIKLLAEKSSNSRGAGWLAGLAVMVWPPFLNTARSARMDTACLALLLIPTLIIIFTEHDQRRLVPSAFAGLLAGIAGLYHSVALPWLVGLLVIQLAFHKRGVMRCLVFGATSVIPASIWLCFAIRFPNEFQDQFLFQLQGRTANSPIWIRLTEEITRSWNDYGHLPGFFLFLTLAVPAAWLLRSQIGVASKRLMLLAAVTFAGITILAGKGSGFYNLYYTILILPLMAVISADACETPTAPPWIGRLLIAAYTLLILNCAIKSYAPRLVAMTVQREARSYDKAFAPLRALLRPGDQVWGAGETWYSCVQAGARLDVSSKSVPIKGSSRPDPKRHRLAVTTSPSENPGAGFSRVLEVRRPIPAFRGHSFTNDYYHYEVWQSTILP